MTEGIDGLPRDPLEEDGWGNPYAMADNDRICESARGRNGNSSSLPV